MSQNVREFYVFEPRSFFERFKGYTQNLFEVYLLTGVAILALIFPSYISLFFFLLTHDLFYISSSKTKTRLTWGLFANYFNIAAVIVIVVMKAIHVKDSQIKLKNETEFHNKVKFYEAFGYSIKNDKDSLKIDLNLLYSFLFEFLVFCLYLMTHSQYSFLQNKVKFATE